ncbi:DNA-binding protein [Geomonas anaerohicana]|uniref:DNA-binding protein n=1 Tax=Geomonas anaerohicana TaxID=2798583 RepID=A0ABS0YD44_9BACT|nr:DNA-binding protein [Geomonas anaerohicana]MBJ6750243.1 DNA-binding protein [Geomonas anaerohicana]
MAGWRLILMAVLLNGLWLGNASAGFLGFGSDDKGKSGLDFNRGYDLNTVGNVSGRVSAAPHQVENEQFIVEVQTASGTVNLSVGPGTYWQKKGIAVRVNDEISAKGARAQGQDGKNYLLTQKLVNKTTGAAVELRSDSGDPVWAMKGTGAGMRSQDGRFGAGGSGGFGGGFMRGGGMMGGGMRR